MKLKIEEVVVPEHRLGRHINHDPVSRNFAFTADTETPVSAKHETYMEILDQGSLGSCTGNAAVAALSYTPFYNTLDDVQKKILNEEGAIFVYSEATKIDPYPGTWQPDDTGSDGLSVAKVLKGLGYISGYRHAFDLNSALVALSKAPVIIGISWYDGFESPDSNGTVQISGQVRGGHEVCLDEIDVESRLVWFRNSWSKNWGIGGRANMSFDTFQQLLNEQGDTTIFVPITAPAPVPTPKRPTANQRLAAAAKNWISKRHVFTANRKFEEELKIWLKSKGY